LIFYKWVQKKEYVLDNQKVNQYLGKNDLIKLSTNTHYDTTMLMTSDTYNESELFSAYDKLNMEDKKLLELCVIQLCVIGYGNKNFGSVKLENKEWAIPEVLKRCNIKHGMGVNEKFEPGELTLRRLMRLLRYQVQNFIINNKRASFLYLKYSTRELKYSHICFPMGEHLVETKDEGLYIYNAYKKLDENKNTKFAERLQRVLVARGILKPNDFA